MAYYISFCHIQCDFPPKNVPAYNFEIPYIWLILLKNNTLDKLPPPFLKILYLEKCHLWWPLGTFYRHYSSLHVTPSPIFSEWTWSARIIKRVIKRVTQAWKKNYIWGPIIYFIEGRSLSRHKRRFCL